MFRIGTRQRSAARVVRQALHVRHRCRDRVLVSVRGQIDNGNAAPIGEALAALVAHSPTVIDLDLTQLTHVSGPGSGAFYRLLKAARARRTAVTIAGANPQVQDDLHRTALNQFLVSADPTGEDLPEAAVPAQTRLKDDHGLRPAPEPL